MAEKFKAVKGTKDILPNDSTKWQTLEQTVHEFMNRWGYGEIRTPAFERTELFARSVGEESDIVSKQMYTFLDQSKTSLTLKPELTAPVMRAYLEHNLDRGGALTKIYYIDALFRQERPQKGRDSWAWSLGRRPWRRVKTQTRIPRRVRSPAPPRKLLQTVYLRGCQSAPRRALL